MPFLATSQNMLCMSGGTEKSLDERRKDRSLSPILYIMIYLVHHVKSLRKEWLPGIGLTLLWSINFESLPWSSISGLYLLAPSTYHRPHDVTIGWRGPPWTSFEQSVGYPVFAPYSRTYKMLGLSLGSGWTDLPTQTLWWRGRWGRNMSLILMLLSSS